MVAVESVKPFNAIPVTKKVGDWYVNELLLKHNWSIGGESSGHIIHRKVTTTGDGIVAALQVLDAVIHSGQSLTELKQSMHKYPQHMINVRMTRQRDMSRIPAVTRAIEACEKELGERGRVLLRPSGTEPVLRVMVEADEQELAERCCKALAASVETVLTALNG